VGLRMRSRSAETDASRRRRAKPVAMNAFRRSRGFHAATMAFTHRVGSRIAIEEDRFRQEIPGRCSDRSADVTREEERQSYILAVRPGVSR